MIHKLEIALIPTNRGIKMLRNHFKTTVPFLDGFESSVLPPPICKKLVNPIYEIISFN